MNKKLNFVPLKLGVLLVAMFVSSCGETTSLPTIGSVDAPPSVTPTQIPTVTPVPSFTPTPITDLHLIIRVEESEVAGIPQITESGVSLTTIRSGDLVELTGPLPGEWVTTQQDLARYELKIIPSGRYTGGCTYSPPATMLLVRMDIEASITDIKNDTVLDSRRFEGHAPDEFDCPPNLTTSDSRITPGLTSPSQFKHWVLLTMLTKSELPLPVVGVSGLSYSPDGKYLAYGSEDFTAKILDVSTGSVSQVLAGHADEVRNVVFSPDGTTLVTAGMDGTARVWDVASGSEMDNHPVYKFSPTIMFSSDGGILAIREKASDYVFWDTSRKGKAFSPFYGNVLAFSPIDMTLARDFGGMRLSLLEIRGFLYTTDTELRGLDINLGIDLIAFSPDGKTLAIWGQTRFGADPEFRVKLIDVERMQEKLTLEKPVFARNMIFSPDGKFLATQDGEFTTLWDTANGKELRTISDPNFTSMTFSPDGKNLITGSWSGIIQIWDVTTGDLRSEITNSFFAP